MSDRLNALQKYLPAGSKELVGQMLKGYGFELRIARPRRSKFGDFRPGDKLRPSKISVNANLNPYAFLITLIHEFAHLRAFGRFGLKIKPHGKEWQQQYRELAQPFLAADIFPADLRVEFARSLQKGAASSASDETLYRCLKKYDRPRKDSLVALEELPQGYYFRIGDKTFVKGAKSRKRFKCQNLQNKRYYMVHPLADVTPLKLNHE